MQEKESEEGSHLHASSRGVEATSSAIASAETQGVHSVLLVAPLAPQISNLLPQREDRWREIYKRKPTNKIQEGQQQSKRSEMTIAGASQAQRAMKF